MNGMGKCIISAFILLLLWNCGTHHYSPLAIYNSMALEKLGNNSYVRLTNDSAQVTMLLLGGFDMAQNKKQFDSIRYKLRKPVHRYGRDKLFYLQNSTAKVYDCALMAHDEKVPSIKETRRFITKNIVCKNSALSFRIYKKTHKENLQLYLDHFKCINK